MDKPQAIAFYKEALQNAIGQRMEEVRASEMAIMLGLDAPTDEMEQAAAEGAFQALFEEGPNP